MKLNISGKKNQFKILSVVGAVCLSLTLSQSGYASSEVQIDVRKTLDQVLSSNKKTNKIIKKGKIKSLHSELSEVRTKLAELNLLIDKEMISGSWQSAETKKSAHRLLDRLESIKTLCFIGVAFTSEYYEYPDKYIPNSVKDAVSKMYAQLETFNKEVEKVTLLSKKPA